jgi:HEAT repeat protein
MGLVKQKGIQLAEPGNRKPERSCKELAAALDDEDACVRRQAAREIASCLGAAAALVSRLKREENVAVREVLLSTLVRLNDPLAVSGLADCLRSEDAALRNEVIGAIKQMGSEVEPVLQSLLADTDPDVRIFAVNILDSERHPDVERWLIQMIERDAHVNVCAVALDLLSEVGTEAAVDPLIRLKARFASEAYIQFAANLALKRIRGV